MLCRKADLLEYNTSSSWIYVTFAHLSKFEPSILIFWAASAAALQIDSVRQRCWNAIIRVVDDSGTKEGEAKPQRWKSKVEFASDRNWFVEAKSQRRRSLTNVTQRLMYGIIFWPSDNTRPWRQTNNNKQNFNHRKQSTKQRHRLKKRTRQG